MRKLLFSSMLAIGFAAFVTAADPAAVQHGSLVTAAVAQQNEAAPADRGADFKADVDINTGAPGATETRKTTWFVDPVYIALAVGAVILIAVLFAAGSRGGNTTVIKE